MSENSEEGPSQFPKDKGDIFKLVAVSEKKQPKTQRYSIYNNLNRWTAEEEYTFEKLDLKNILVF